MSLEIPGALEKVVTVVSRTFEDIIAACRSAAVEANLALAEVIEDYEEYCLDANLMSGEADRMLVLGTGETIDENLDLRLYYRRVSESLQKHRYLGLYNNKAIVAVGKIEKSVFAELVDGRLAIREQNVSLTRDEEERIITAIKLAPSHGYETSRDHRFLLVNRFIRTDFRKVSPGGMMGKRYFSLNREIEVHPGDTLPDIDTIAERLNGRTWE